MAKRKLKSGAGIRTRVSTGGQWLVAWQKANPGMFMPGVSMQQAQASGVANGYDPNKALWAAQDPSWGVAALKQMASQGSGPLAGGGAPTDPGAAGGGDAGAYKYVPSAWLANEQSMHDSSYATADTQRAHDLGRLGYLTGVGEGSDPNNRFSQFNLLNRAFGRTLTGLETGAASAGDRFSGQYQQQLDDARFGRDQGGYDINQNVLDTSEGINRTNAAAKQSADERLSSAGQTDVDHWLDMIRGMGSAASGG